MVNVSIGASFKQRNRVDKRVARFVPAMTWHGLGRGVVILKHPRKFDGDRRVRSKWEAHLDHMGDSVL